MGKIGIYLQFKIKQDYISKNLCENRTKPDSDCKGSCYLSKEIKKHSQENKVQIEINTANDYFIHGGLDSDYSFVSKLLYQTKFKEYCPSGYHYLHSKSLFQPPSFLS